MLTYSDLMNLLLILFIILYCSSKVDLQKATQVAESIKKGFNATEIKVGSTPAFQTSRPATPSQAGVSGNTGDSYQKLYEDIENLIQEQKLQNEVTVQSATKGVVISLRDNVLFAQSSATLDTTAQTLLKRVGGILKQVDFSQIVVEGFTDSDPIHTAQFQDNRDLSSERANNVARLLQFQCGIAPEKLSSLGYGEYRPVAPNDTPANKAKNRRVVITVLKPDITADAVVEADKLTKGLTSGTPVMSQASAASESSGTVHSVSH